MYTSCGQIDIHDPALIQKPHGLGFRLVWFRVEVLGFRLVWLRVEDLGLGLFGSGLKISIFGPPEFKTLRA